MKKETEKVEISKKDWERNQANQELMLEKITQLEKDKLKSDAKLNPKSGPGKLCEAWKITFGEALQIGPDENGKFPRVPDGYVIKKKFDRNRQFYVYPDTPEDEFLPNCESKYTKPYKRNVRVAGKSYPDFEYDKEEVQLCNKHAHTLLGKTLEE